VTDTAIEVTLAGTVKLETPGAVKAMDAGLAASAGPARPKGARVTPARVRSATRDRRSTGASSDSHASQRVSGDLPPRDASPPLIFGNRCPLEQQAERIPDSGLSVSDVETFASSRFVAVIVYVTCCPTAAVPPEGRLVLLT